MEISSGFIYMLEDDSDDRLITSTALDELGINVPVIYFSDGNELLKALETGKRPLLILLDYRITNEMKLLEQLKSKESFSDIPVIVLSELAPEGAIRECYRLGANSFVIKPSDPKETLKKIKIFFQYWLEVAEA